MTAQGVAFLLHHTAHRRLFGLKALWRGSLRVSISDPARTLIDLLAMPDVGGGIDHVADCLAAYQKTTAYDSDPLVRYGEQFGNGAVFKRLGILAETYLHDAKLAAACRARLTQGYGQFDPALPSGHLLTAWRLWVPERWKRGAPGQDSIVLQVQRAGKMDAQSSSEVAMDWKQYITTDPSILHGAVCFVGTRIPVTVVLDNLADGAASAEILRQYPGLRAEHVPAALGYAAELARERVVPIPA